MSAVGGTYAYDVFFSYAWASNTGESDLRDWTRKVATVISSLLRVRFNGVTSGFAPYLDRDANIAGADLDKKLEGAATTSAIFVAIVSSFYNTPYCEREVQWFCDQIRKEGAPLDDRLYILRVQTAPTWPELLKGQNGEPRLYLDLCDIRGQPVGLAQFIVDGSLKGAADGIEKAALEIGDKLVTLREQIVARDAYQRSLRPPTDPLIFLEAERTDQARWAAFADFIKGGPSIVMPASQTAVPADEISSADFDGLDGLVLLRSRATDEIGSRIKTAYLRRRAIYAEKNRNLPWVLLDELDSEPPEGAAFSVPRIRPEGEWVKELLHILSGA
jgi:hypothetical protein